MNGVKISGINGVGVSYPHELMFPCPVFWGTYRFGTEIEHIVG